MQTNLIHIQNKTSEKAAVLNQTLGDVILCDPYIRLKAVKLFANSVSCFFSLRLGWEGAGLGRSQQGIYDPISGGDVRDKFDKFKVRDTIYRLIDQWSLFD